MILHPHRPSQHASRAEDDREHYESNPLRHLLALHESPVPLSSDLHKAQIASKGLAKRSALHMQVMLGITARNMSELLDMSYRTYQRKRPDQSLGMSATAQLIMIAEAFAHAIRVLNGDAGALEWFNTRLAGLGGERPLDLMRTPFGIRLIRQALGRLEHGIPA